MILPTVDWSELWRESRSEIIGGLVVLILGALAAAVWRILRRKKSLDNGLPVPVQPPPPQEVRVKVETVSPAPQPSPALPVTATITKGYIPRPPIAGFVARRDESGRDIVERLKEELAPEKEQLVVLWGAGGVGKTTLAAETARVMRPLFEGGTIWSSADGKPDYSLSTLLDEIATHLERSELRQLALGLKDEEVHLALLRAPNTLIVLDNLETVAPEEQEKCADWLANRASCPALITSRYEVAHARPVRISAMSLDEAREFLKRLISDARNPRVFEQLDKEQIIQAADRVPLILQWLVKQIDSAKQPSSVMEELSHGEGDAAQRVFDRSFNLAQVGDDGRATLLALSLFVPSASRVALCEVAGFGHDIERLERAAQQLADLSLIQTTDRNARLKVEGLTRELTRARLDKDDCAEDYRQQFVAYFQDYAEKHSGRTPQHYDELEIEKDNLLNAMDMASQFDDPQSLFRLAYTVALPVYGMLSVRGYWAETLKANQQALEAARQSNSQGDIANFAHNVALMYSNRGALQESRELYNESLQIQRDLGNQRSIANSLHHLAWLAHMQGRLDEARRLYDESLTILRELNDEEGIASSLHHLAMLAQDQGELNEARRLFEEALQIAKRLNHQYGMSLGLHHLGMIAHSEGELREARRLYEESLKIKTELGDQSGMASSFGMLGRLAEDEGDPKEAARLYGEALTIFDRLKSPNAAIARSDLERLADNAPT